MLLQMVDGGILDFQEDRESYSGCETCDYGSEYINEFTVILTTCAVKAQVSQMYEFALSEGHVMKTILPNTEVIKSMTEDGFAMWFESTLRSVVGEDEYSNTKLEFEILKK